MAPPSEYTSFYSANTFATVVLLPVNLSERYSVYQKVGTLVSHSILWKNLAMVDNSILKYIPRIETVD